ncbi:MAG: hypothetical protein AAFU77_13520 [Myxococcota bacterium]
MLRVFCVLLLSAFALPAAAAPQPEEREVITVRPAPNEVDRFADRMAKKRTSQRERLTRLKAKSDARHLAYAERVFFLRAITMPVTADGAIATR